METVIHQHGDTAIAEIITNTLLIATPQDALDILVNPKLAGARKIIMHQESLAPDFFELRTGLAGEILQKFVNYRIQLAIVGNFSTVTSESLKAFIRESNRGTHIFFCPDVASAIQKLMST